VERISEALSQLREAFKESDRGTLSGCITSKTSSEALVDVFIAFDEAHTLTEAFDTKGQSRFIVLHQLLFDIAHCPLFTFFLSTTGKITQFGQPRGKDPSNRIIQGIYSTPRPFIYLGFDQLVDSFSKGISGKHTLDDVTSLEYAAYMGRPL
jgi:hypothetical protein